MIYIYEIYDIYIMQYNIKYMDIAVICIKLKYIRVLYILQHPRVHIHDNLKRLSYTRQAGSEALFPTKPRHPVQPKPEHHKAGLNPDTKGSTGLSWNKSEWLREHRFGKLRFRLFSSGCYKGSGFSGLIRVRIYRISTRSFRLWHFQVSGIDGVLE